MSNTATTTQNIKKDDDTQITEELEKDTLVELETGMSGEREQLPGVPKEYSGWDVYNNEAKKVDTELVNELKPNALAALEWIDHYEYGKVVLPNSPLRFHGAEKVPTTVNPKVGEHNEAVYGDLLGLTPDDLRKLNETGAI